MAGKSRLDILDERIRQIERRQDGDGVAAWLGALSDDQLHELHRRVCAGEPPATILEDMKL